MSHSLQSLPAHGTPFEGGFFGGVVRHSEQLHAVAWAPKAEGESRQILLPSGHDGVRLVATSCSDCLGNTRALAELGSPAALWTLGLRIGGFADWAVPARDVLELGYRFLKPGTCETYCSFRDGDNPSSVPSGYPYLDGEIRQTSALDFRSGGPQAFEERWYRTSTQAGSGSAWFQLFDDGVQGATTGVSAECAVRAVRLIPLSA